MNLFPSRFLHLSNCLLSAVRCLRTMSPTKRVKVSDVPALGDKGIASRLSIYQGDITQLEVTMIVNAANSSLLGGGGVDGAIHRAAGSELLEACRPLSGCKTGDAKMTPGFKLPAKYVSHTVGPIYPNHKPEKAADLLSSCYARSLELAAEQSESGDATIAFPSISCGVYGYPFEDAAHVALRTVKAKLEDPSGAAISRVIFVVFSDGHRQTYERLAKDYV